VNRHEVEICLEKRRKLIHAKLIWKNTKNIKSSPYHLLKEMTRRGAGCHGYLNWMRELRGLLSSD
jgi:hypothetical protein